MPSGFLQRLWPRRPRLRTVLLITLTFGTTATLIISWFSIFRFALPMRRAYHVESEYLQEQDRDHFAEEIYDTIGKAIKNKTKRAPFRRRVRPLIQDVAQLHYQDVMNSRTYDQWLGLNPDGTAQPKCRGQEYWIYVGGTAKPPSDLVSKEGSKEETFNHRYKEHTCEDPAYMCNAYNEAFDRISARWHGLDATGNLKSQPQRKRTSKALLRFADCDITPLFCSNFWGIGGSPVILIRLKIGNDCENSMGYGRCSASWRFVGLPFYHLPWSRMIRVELDKRGSTVVPAFPDAEETMWSLMSQSGAETALSTTDYMDSIYTPVANERPSYTEFLGLDNWAGLRTMVDNPFAAEKSPKEIVLKCYVERYLDVILRWWDRSYDTVFPRNDCWGMLVRVWRDRGRRIRG